MTSDFYRYFGDSPARLFDRGVPLIDIAAMAANLPPDSATIRALNPPDVDDVWDLQAQLMARVADELAVISYIQSRKAGGKPSKPKPIRRPGVRPEKETSTFGGEGALPIDELDAWLGEAWLAAKSRN